MQMLLAILVLVACAQARHCCTPHEWEGEATGYDHKRNVSFFETISYDYTNRRVRVDLFDHHDRQFHHMTVFEEISRRDGKNRLFIVTGDKCAVHERAEPFRQACVRENHHEERELKIGGELEAVWYGFRDRHIAEFAVVSKHHCLPIEGVFLEHHDREYSFEARISYFNVRHGIGNPVVFEIPHSCKY